MKDEREALAESLVRKICRAIKELKNLGIERVQFTLSDYVEWKVCKILDLKRERSLIREGYDARDERGKKYQIKYRTNDENKFTGFGNIKFDKFDFLLCVFVSKEDFGIQAIYKVPHDTVKKYTKKWQTQSFRWTSEAKHDETIEKVYPS